MADNIWAGIEPANIELPIQVLKDYASSFNENFRGKMAMVVKTKMDDSKIVTIESLFESPSESEKSRCDINVSIDVPSLKGYSLKMLVVSYDIRKIYPCSINNMLNNTTEECPDSATFKSKIVALFTGDEFTQVLRNLLAQVD